MLFFWLGGFLVKFFFKNIRVNKVDLEMFKSEIFITKSKLKILFFIAYPLILIVGLKIYFKLSQYGFNLADDDFQQSLGSGFIAHSILLLNIISIFLMIFYNNKYYIFFQILIIVFSLVFSVFYGVKSWIIIPIMSSFFGRLLLKKTSLKFKHFFVFTSPFLIFWLIYKISLGFDSSNDDFIIDHMIDYLLAGPIGFSEHLNQNLPIGSNPGIAFTPIINVFNLINGSKLAEPISSYYVLIPTGFEPNVKTFFGTLYIYGDLSYLSVSFFFGVVFYCYLLLFCLFLKSGNAPFLTTLYVFMLGLLFMGWFDSYVVHLTFYEVPFWTFFLFLVFKIKFSS
jgi:hypothetical protein